MKRLIKFLLKLFILGILALIGLWLIPWHYLNFPYVAIPVGCAIGGGAMFLVMRKLGRLSNKSIVAGDIFSLLTGYEVKAYIHKQGIVDKEDKIELRQDTKNIMLILTKELKFTKQEAECATDYVIETSPLHAPLDQKIKRALQYLGKN